MWAVLREAADSEGRLDYPTFVQHALYAPECGYYTRSDKQRIGRTRGADFTTASELQPVFGELVAAASAHLLKAQGRVVAEHTFIEIGAERVGGVLEGIDHPFREVRAIRVGEAIELEGACVVFSNELFDAQPFRRFQRMGGEWQELGVQLGGEPGDIEEIMLPEISEAAEQDLDDVLRLAQGRALNAQPEGSVLDYSSGATALLQRMTGQPWQGLFLAIDYGMALEAMLENCPEGTARSYRQHRQHNAIWEAPGEQDITLHVCWDALEMVLRKAGFQDVQLRRQEAFFVEKAAKRVMELAGEIDPMSDSKRKLMALLHPAHYGSKCQALWATR